MKILNTFCATSITIVGLLSLNINFAVGEKGANINEKDINGETALIWAAGSGYEFYNYCIKFTDT